MKMISIVATPATKANDECCRADPNRVTWPNNGWVAKTFRGRSTGTGNDFSRHEGLRSSRFGGSHHRQLIVSLILWQYAK